MSRSRKAFTLVELLVVITIIGMLMALLLPAVQAARESARRVTCTNNHKNVGLAAINYESAHNRFPGTTNVVGESSGSWVVALLPFLDRKDIYKKWEAGQGATLGKVQLSVLICPSNPPENTGLHDTSCGLVCNTEIFRDGRNSRSMDWLTRNDGASNTLMITETLQADLKWDTVGVGFGIGGSSGSSGSGTAAGAEPSSNHGGGFNGAFCDGHVVFLRNDLEDGVLEMLIRGDDCKNEGGPVLDESMYTQ